MNELLHPSRRNAELTATPEQALDKIAFAGRAPCRACANCRCALVDGLSDADASVQSMADASPSKWHIAHTTWSSRPSCCAISCARYRPFDERFAFLYNSYYEAEGDRIARPSRGLLTRPSLDEIRAYRRHVDEALTQALDDFRRQRSNLSCSDAIMRSSTRSCSLPDLLHLFAQNPLLPAAWPPRDRRRGAGTGELRWIEGREGRVDIGHGGSGFAYDCEGPRHAVWLAPHALADRLTTNGEWRDFVEDGRLQHGEPLAVGWLGLVAREWDRGAPQWLRDPKRRMVERIRAGWALCGSIPQARCGT